MKKKIENDFITMDLEWLGVYGNCKVKVNKKILNLIWECLEDYLFSLSHKELNDLFREAGADESLLYTDKEKEEPNLD